MFSTLLISTQVWCLIDRTIGLFFLLLSSERPSAWCKDNWIHWRALKSAFSVETQLRDILNRLQQVLLRFHADGYSALSFMYLFYLLVFAH